MLPTPGPVCLCVAGDFHTGAEVCLPLPFHHHAGTGCFRWVVAAAGWAAGAWVSLVLFCFLSLGLRLWQLKSLIVVSLSGFSSKPTALNSEMVCSQDTSGPL